MKKIFVIIAVSILFACHAVQAVEKYTSSEEAFAEWLLLDTCMNYATELKNQKPSMDANHEFFVCVSEAKKIKADQEINLRRENSDKRYSFFGHTFIKYTCCQRNWHRE